MQSVQRKIQRITHTHVQIRNAKMDFQGPQSIPGIENHPMCSGRTQLNYISMDKNHLHNYQFSTTSRVAKQLQDREEQVNPTRAG